MGCGASSFDITDDTKAIDRQIVMQKKKLENSAKLLLLGAGSSGKSTVAKQMKIIHLNGFSDSDKASYVPILHSNAIDIIQTIVRAQDELGIEFGDDELVQLAAKYFVFNSVGVSIDNALKDELEKLWNCKPVQELLAIPEKRAELQLFSSADYVMENLDRFCQPSFVPEVVDILNCRARTVGVSEVEFDMESVHFKMIDVGGQRSERKKWAHHFDDVAAIIFVAALDGYDLKLYEEPTVNRIQEARALFDDIVNSGWFRDTPIILFLNKSDLFKEKIKHVPLTVCFQDYMHGDDYDEATRFLRHKFKKLNANKQRVIYAHITCAINTDNISFVFSAVMDTVLDGSLKTLGI